MASDLQKLIRLAKKADWRVEVRKSGHLVWIGPKGQKVFSGRTLSDVRAVKNLKGELRRHGLKV